MDKCPHCGAETRPGDHFCLSCGNRLIPATPAYVQAQPVMGDATLPTPDEWGPPPQGGLPTVGSGMSWPEANASMPTVASGVAEMSPASVSADSHETAVATAAAIEKPAQFILKSENGDVLQEYTLDKLEIAIGRAPNSDILLSKDKLTSRRHATVRYENGQYILRDERSANGTFVNGQQLEELVPYVLQDGDHIGIGEHELIFRAHPSAVADLPTVSINPTELTYRTQGDNELTAASPDTLATHSESEGVLPSPSMPPTIIGSEAEPVASPASPTLVAPEPAPPPAPQRPVMTTIDPASPELASTNVTFSRLTSLPLPTLPDMSSLMAALATLDGQVSALQEQLNGTQEALRNHEAEIAQTTNQLRTGVRRVAERMDQTIADVARSREALAWSELIQLMDDVTNNPRDIEYVTRLARKARELNKVFQIHQSVLNTLAECNSLLRALIGEEH
jgi:pSer/pThr/pTyr-binding forkhead associated (FHA) protein